ncbi:MAG: NRDE family protein, partial [Chitinophagales bacterium]
MCLINFAFQKASQYPLILIGNRDEFYSRPTQELHWWTEDGLDILAGKDLKDGGTWMGMNRQGKFGALTNYRDFRNIKEQAPSRGIIIKKFLSGLPTEEMHRYLKTQGKLFNGFNIIYGDINEFFFYSNETDRIQNIYPGIYSLSNALLDTPWPKQVKSKIAFENAIADINNESHFFEYMHDTSL